MGKSLLTTAHEWREARAKRLALEKEVAELKAQEDLLKAALITALRRSKNKALSDGARLIQLKVQNEPTVEDWPSFYDHIKATGHFELLYRRVNPAAVKERWEIGEKVPGVVSIPVETLSDTKAK